MALITFSLLKLYALYLNEAFGMSTWKYSALFHSLSVIRMYLTRNLRILLFFSFNISIFVLHLFNSIIMGYKQFLNFLIVLPKHHIFSLNSLTRFFFLFSSLDSFYLVQVYSRNLPLRLSSTQKSRKEAENSPSG